MAKIIDNETSCRRIIKLSVDDIISIVQDYQRIVPARTNLQNIRLHLSNSNIFIPEDI